MIETTILFSLTVSHVNYEPDFYLIIMIDFQKCILITGFSLKVFNGILNCYYYDNIGNHSNMEVIPTCFIQ